MKSNEKRPPRDAIAEEVGKDWLPLHRAPFFFFPQFGHVHQLVELIEALTSVDRNLFSISHDEESRVRVTKDGVELVIDMEAGEFSIGPTDPKHEFEQVTTGMDDPLGRPDEFLQKLDSVEAAPGFESGLDALRQIAERLWRSLRRRFESAINTGTATVFGRWQERDAPFTRVYPDQWCQFEIETIDNRNEYSSEFGLQSRLVFEGEVIHSVHVKPSKLASRKSSATEERARQRLVALMREAPDNPKPQRTLRPAFTDLSNEGFKRVWQDAIEEAPAPKWGKGGRRLGSKSGKSTGTSNKVVKIFRKKP